jgi:ATP-dependent exoDNAse (exonuclease V) beta subunit
VLDPEFKLQYHQVNKKINTNNLRKLQCVHGYCYCHENQSAFIEKYLFLFSLDWPFVYLRVG